MNIRTNLIKRNQYNAEFSFLTKVQMLLDYEEEFLSGDFIETFESFIDELLEENKSNLKKIQDN